MIDVVLHVDERQLHALVPLFAPAELEAYLGEVRALVERMAGDLDVIAKRWEDAAAKRGASNVLMFRRRS